MKSLPTKAVIKILENNGFLFLRQRGSHSVYFNPETKSTVIVVSHRKNKILPIGTFLALVKQSKLPIQKFKKR